MSSVVPNLHKLFEIDPYLEPQQANIEHLYTCFLNTKHRILENHKSLDEFVTSYNRYGIQKISDNSITSREWAPNLAKISLAGDFNSWDQHQYCLNEVREGVWELEIPVTDAGQCPIPSGTELRYFCRDKQGNTFDRISPWAGFVTQKKDRVVYNQMFWAPEERYTWAHRKPKVPKALYIYEAHVGISSPEPKISTYLEFADTVIPRIARLGYNCIQLMAVMEHAYYASFGYQVTSFFSPSSRYGTPDELKYLIDTAHKHDIVVLLDLVHSHASNNTTDGLNSFDGSDTHYFLAGSEGRHSQWKSRLFDYHKIETLQFLMSNINYWVSEYRFDGFRFDGVTSMLYHHHGISFGFSGDYHEYFNEHRNISACVYLMLANEFLHDTYPDIITIAEDVSGMPGLCRPVKEGGFGFDYRLAMSIPDMWIKLLKESASDAQWDMGHITFTLNNRRYMEKTIAYAESHDQALVGDKTLAFWLMDKDMYTNMSVLSPLTPRVERGMSLHKMLRLITFGLGGEGILTFMGNEFGHPEWLDFPRVGNNESYHYCRRQYNLADDEMLRYKFLERFDGFILETEREHPWLQKPNGYIYLSHESDKIVVFERGGLIFVFNFHWESFVDYAVQVKEAGKYRVQLDSDHSFFGGHGRLDNTVRYFSYPVDEKCFIKTYLPSRTCLIYRLDHDDVEQE